MNRGRGFAAAAALIAAVSLAPALAPLASPERAAADCSWQRHSKRIVKQVRSRGRARRIVRVRHWWRCEPVAPVPAIGPPPVAAPAPSPPPAPAAEPEADPSIARLSVKAVEYGYTLSRPNVVPGEVIVELNNQGEDAHNLNLQLEGSEAPALEIGETGPTERRTARFTVDAGTYKLWCSLPTHEEEGMVTTLRVEEN